MDTSTLIIGSRGSKLALFQANWVKSQLEAHYPRIEVRVEIIKTSGDIFFDAPLSQVGGKGLFTKEIEEALLAGKIDLAVHSLKDLPTVLPEGLCLAAVSQREDVRDAFVSNQFNRLAELPIGASVGTSSLRRQSQLLALRNDLEIRNLRGNLETRLRKLDEGHYDAILLACAGLNRLGFRERIRERIPVEQICPAIGQGALGMEARSRDVCTLEKLRCLHHRETHITVTAERALLRRLGGGCQVPIAGHAWIQDGRLQMLGVVASIDGQHVVRDRASASLEDAEQLGCRLAENLLTKGAQAIVGAPAGQSDSSEEL
jgi:hydroxymethylbilane synthase